MENPYLLKNNPQYNLKYKKVKNNRSINNIQRKKISKKENMSAYDEIILRGYNINLRVTNLKERKVINRVIK